MPSTSPRWSVRLASDGRTAPARPATSRMASPGGARGAREERVDGAARHLLDEDGGVGAFHRAGARGAAVAQDGVGVGDGLHLLEEVGDVEDAHALGAEAAEDGEEPLHVGAGEAGGGLVEDEDACTWSARARARSRRAAARRAAGRRRGRRGSSRGAERRERGGGAARELPAADEAEARGLDAEQDVLGDGEVRAERELLVDHGDAGAARVLRAARAVGGAVEEDLARVEALARPRGSPAACSCRRRSRRRARGSRRARRRDPPRRAATVAPKALRRPRTSSRVVTWGSR